MASCLVLGATLFVPDGARAAQGRLAPLVTAGLTYSGDQWIAGVEPTDRPIMVRAGGGVIVGGGLQWESGTYPVQASLVGSYHYDPRAGVYLNATFRSVPIDAMVYYTGLETVRFGVGLGYVVAPEARPEVEGQVWPVKYKNALSKSFEIGYRIAPRIWANLRLSNARFEPKTASALTQEADVTLVAVNMSYAF
jgi:hypothetical protein